MLSERPWKLEGVLRLMVGMLVSVCCFVLLRAACEHIFGKAHFADGAFLSLLFNTLMVHGSIILGTTYMLVSQKQTITDYFGITRATSRAMRYGVLGAVAFVPVGMLLQALSIKAITVVSHHVPDKQAAVEQFSKAVTWPGRTWFVFFAIVIAPIAEEILFRGIIYGILRQARLSRAALRGITVLLTSTPARHFRGIIHGALRQARLPRTALCVSAFFFAASHAQDGDKNFLALAAIFVPLFILGLLLAWLYETTDNLLASITAHSLFNGINIVLMFLLKW